MNNLNKKQTLNSLNKKLKDLLTKQQQKSNDLKLKCDQMSNEIETSASNLLDILSKQQIKLRYDLKDTQCDLETKINDLQRNQRTIELKLNEFKRNQNSNEAFDVNELVSLKIQLNKQVIDINNIDFINEFNPAESDSVRIGEIESDQVNFFSSLIFF